MLIYPIARRTLYVSPIKQAIEKQVLNSRCFPFFSHMKPMSVTKKMEYLYIQVLTIVYYQYNILYPSWFIEIVLTW